MVLASFLIKFEDNLAVQTKIVLEKKWNKATKSITTSSIDCAKLKNVFVSENWKTFSKNIFRDKLQCDIVYVWDGFK